MLGLGSHMKGNIMLAFESNSPQLWGPMFPRPSSPTPVPAPRAPAGKQEMHTHSSQQVPKRYQLLAGAFALHQDKHIEKQDNKRLTEKYETLVNNPGKERPFYV